MVEILVRLGLWTRVGGVLPLSLPLWSGLGFSQNVSWTLITLRFQATVRLLHPRRWLCSECQSL